MTLPGYDELKSSMVGRQPALPKRMEAAARFMFANPGEAAFSTASAIGAAAGVHPSVVSRLAQHLGYHGFNELQSVFRERLVNRIPAENAVDQGDMSAQRDASFTILEHLVAACRGSLETVARDFDIASFKRCADLLARADSIFIAGQRQASPAAWQMVYAMVKLGIKAIVVRPDHLYEIEKATPNDAAVVIEVPFQGSSTARLEQFLELRSVPLAKWILDSGSPLVDDFDQYRSDVHPLMANMVLAPALAMAVAERRRIQRCPKAEHNSTLPGRRDG